MSVLATMSEEPTGGHSMSVIQIEPRGVARVPFIIHSGQSISRRATSADSTRSRCRCRRRGRARTSRFSPLKTHWNLCQRVPDQPARRRCDRGTTSRVIIAPVTVDHLRGCAS